jgi:hypothetical protein
VGELGSEVEHGGGLANATLLVCTHDDRRVGSGWVLGGVIHLNIVAGGGYDSVLQAVFHVEQVSLIEAVRLGGGGSILSA